MHIYTWIYIYAIEITLLGMSRRNGPCICEQRHRLLSIRNSSRYPTARYTAFWPCRLLLASCHRTGRTEKQHLVHQEAGLEKRHSSCRKLEKAEVRSTTVRSTTFGCMSVHCRVCKRQPHNKTFLGKPWETR